MPVFSQVPLRKWTAKAAVLMVMPMTIAQGMPYSARGGVLGEDEGEGDFD